MKLISLFIADSIASEVSRIRAEAEAQAVRRGRIRVPAGARAWLMRVTRTLIPFLVLCLMLGMTGCDLNLLGQTRFTVDGQVFGLNEVRCGPSVTIGLGRVGGPTNPTQASDVEAISQVPGIVIVNPEGARVDVAEVTYDPYGGGEWASPDLFRDGRPVRALDPHMARSRSRAALPRRNHA